MEEDFEMRQKIAIAVALMVAGLLTASAAAPQGNAPPSLQEQLEAQYQLTKMNAGTVVPGTVLVTQKEGVFGVPSSSNISPTATYKDGVLHAPGADVLAKCGKDIRPLPKGEKVYVYKIDVNLKEDWVMLSIIECGACTGVMPPSPRFLTFTPRPKPHPQPRWDSQAKGSPTMTSSSWSR
jgi:hypothetical protein